LTLANQRRGHPRLVEKNTERLQRLNASGLNGLNNYAARWLVRPFWASQDIQRSLRYFANSEKNLSLANRVSNCTDHLSDVLRDMEIPFMLYMTVD